MPFSVCECTMRFVKICSSSSKVAACLHSRGVQMCKTDLVDDIILPTGRILKSVPVCIDMF